jgi:uncharacterized Zn finger protein (UPF0148 family)
MDAQPQKNNDKTANVKNAAELLVKGASLISDACNICKGVQIKFKDKIMCINCGNVENRSQTVTSTRTQPAINSDLDKTHSEKISLDSLELRIQSKILMLSRQLNDQEDIVLQRQSAELLEIYLRILEKTLHLKSQLQV